VGAKRQREWSLNGAARAAREARIATVKHLSEAPIARLWHMGKLQRAYQLQAASVGDSAAATALLFGGLGYQPPFPSDWQAATEMVVTDEARYLAKADLYILTPNMCDVVVAAAQTLTREDLELLSEDDLPARTGLVILPHPVIVRAVTGDLGDDRAFTWRFPAHFWRPSRRGHKDLLAVRMSAYHDSYGPVRPDSFLDFAARARAQGTPLPPLLLDAIRCMPLQFAATPEQVQALENYVTTVRQAGDAAREQVAAGGLDENRVVGEYTPGEQVEDRDDTFMPRFLYAFWRLCQQQIATMETPQVNHSAHAVAHRCGGDRPWRPERLNGASGPSARATWPQHRQRTGYPCAANHGNESPATRPLAEQEAIYVAESSAVAACPPGSSRRRLRRRWPGVSAGLCLGGPARRTPGRGCATRFAQLIRHADRIALTGHAVRSG